MIGVDRRIVLDTESLDRDVMNYRVGAELSGWVFLLVAGLLALDWWMSNGFMRSQGAEPEAGAAETFVEVFKQMGRGHLTPPVPVRSDEKYTSSTYRDWLWMEHSS